jgi:hypothetical protein
VTTFHALFWDGPCAKKTRVINADPYAPETQTCGGATYVRGTAPNDLYPTYFVSTGKYAQGIAVAGEQDVFRAWSHLHTSLNKSVGRAAVKMSDARRRIRRAVR